MSETKLPDVAPSMRKAALEYAASIARDTEKFGRLVPIETYMMAMTLLADERLRSHAGWATTEAIEDLRAESERQGVVKIKDRRSHADWYEAIEKLAEEFNTDQIDAATFGCRVFDVLSNAALLPPGGEKG